MRLAVTVGDLSRIALTISADTACADLDMTFRGDNKLSCVAVSDGERLGLVMREAFGQMMSGPFGYGRTLWARRSVREITDWAPLRVAADSMVPAVANRMRTRPEIHRYDDVLVDIDSNTVGHASAADLFDGLARQFAYRAIHDDLTGLVNRTHFLELLSAICADFRDNRVMLALIDLDGMKRINDTYGHTVGDAVLSRVARQLTNAARAGEVVARLGADEFVVLTRTSRRGSATDAAREFGQRFLLAIGAPSDTRIPEGRLTASVGVSVSGDRADPTTLLSEADMAMFTAKQAGGGQVHATADVEADLAIGVDLVDRTVAQAIESGEMRVWYQPIVRIADRSLVAIEALVRWAHPRMGMLAPDRFLPGARRAGHLPDLDRWVFARACADIMELDRRLGSRSPTQIAVNISPATLAADFDELVTSALAETGLAASRLLVELPEGASLDTLNAATRGLERLRHLGVGLVLDDMGAGSTSLRHLSALTIGGLKIDATFVNGMIHNPRDHTVVKLLADLGRGLDLPVTAEGVESLEQLAALAELDVEYAQGYYLGRPQPLDILADRIVDVGSRVS
jgi:diguanylate cyclase (GGDEF)-like protein